MQDYLGRLLVLVPATALAKYSSLENPTFTDPKLMKSRPRSRNEESSKPTRIP